MRLRSARAEDQHRSSRLPTGAAACGTLPLLPEYQVVDTDAARSIVMATKPHVSEDRGAPERCETISRASCARKAAGGPIQRRSPILAQYYAMARAQVGDAFQLHISDVRGRK